MNKEYLIIWGTTWGSDDTTEWEEIKGEEEMKKRVKDINTDLMYSRKVFEVYEIARKLDEKEY